MDPRENTAKEILKKGSVITAITLISRPLGYVREAIQAYLFGATLLVDAFIVAFNFPELIQTLFFSGATSAFLVPVCTKYMGDKEDFSKIYATFINLSITITLAASILFFLFSSAIVRVIAPGFSPEAQDITRLLFVIMIPVIMFHTILSVMKAFLNAKEHFAAPELSGIFWNLAFIAAALFLQKQFGIYSLAIGVTAGALIQIFIQLPYLKRLHIRYSFSMNLSHPSVLEAKNLFLGALIATSIVPINSFIGRIIGSYLPQGEVASLAYAFRIFILPFSLFAVPVYTVMFSKVSRLYHERKMKEIFVNIDSSIILIAITLIPSTVVACTMGDDLIKILYERGAFTARETAITNRALFGYSVGLLFYALSLSFVRIFNAFHDMKTPALVGVSSILLNAVLAYFFMITLGNLGISLATSLVSFYNFLVLLIILKKRTGYRFARSTIREISKALLAGIILTAFILGVKTMIPTGFIISTIVNLVLAVGIYGIFFKDYYKIFLKRR